jgi:GNAT superfamily N-acetyltransferase
MADLIYDPPLPPRPGTDGFVQTIRFIEGDRPIAIARWHVSGDASEGVAQILELNVFAPHARHGHGRKLLDAVISQATAYHRSRKSVLRRLWISVEQKRQVIGRSFLTGRGFHHVATMKELIVDQDALLYMKSFD